MNYCEWAAKHGKQPSAVPMRDILGLPPKDDPLAASVRVALDARKLGWGAERTTEAMERHGGAGIIVEEHCLPDTVRRPVMSLEEMAIREAEEEAALLLARSAR